MRGVLRGLCLLLLAQVLCGHSLQLRPLTLSLPLFTSKSRSASRLGASWPGTKSFLSGRPFASTTQATHSAAVLPHQPTRENSSTSYRLSTTGLLLCGAISRTAAALAVHPLHVIKVNSQLKESPVKSPSLFSSEFLSRGLGAQLLLTLPHGALNFAAAESVKRILVNYTSELPVQSRQKLDPAFDLLSAGFASVICSVISIPQMMLTDRILAGLYPNLRYGLRDIIQKKGIAGLYEGWIPGMSLKLPSNALMWMFYQQLRQTLPPNELKKYRHGIAGLASAATCTLMNPIDTVKTRLMAQRQSGTTNNVLYRDMLDCFKKVLHNEGWTAFYTSLPPRLLSIVPMMGIQFAVYEYLKSTLLQEGGFNFTRVKIILPAREKNSSGISYLFPRRGGSTVFQQSELIDRNISDSATDNVVHDQNDGEVVNTTGETSQQIHRKIPPPPPCDVT